MPRGLREGKSESPGDTVHFVVEQEKQVMGRQRHAPTTALAESDLPTAREISTKGSKASKSTSGCRRESPAFLQDALLAMGEDWKKGKGSHGQDFEL